MQQDNSTLNTLSIKETIESLSLANAVVPVHVSDDMLFGEPYPGYRIVTREEFNKLSRGWLNNPKSKKDRTIRDSSQTVREVFLAPVMSAYSNDAIRNALDARAIDIKDVAINQHGIVFTRHGYASILLNDFVCSKPVLAYVLQPRVQVEVNGVTQTFTLSPSFKQAGYEITTRVVVALESLLDPKNLISCTRCSRITGVNESICSLVLLYLLVEWFRTHPIDLSNVKRIGIDEHSIHKGQDYVVVIFCLDTGRLLYVCKGRAKEDVKPFFEHLKALGLDKNIEFFSSDNASGFIALAQEFLPDSIQSLDHFHVIRDFGKRCCTPLVGLVRKQEQAKLKLMQAEQKRKELFETTLAYQKAQQNALASDQPVESKFRKQAATAKIELGYAEAKVARAEYELSQLNVSDSDCLLIKQQTSEEAIAAAQSNLDVMGSLRFHIFSYERLKKKAESPQASEKIKDAFRVVEANPTLREFAQLGDSLGKLWAPNTTPEMAQQSLDAIKEKLLQLMPDTALVKSFCSFLTRRQGQLIYAGMAQVSNSRVEGMNSQAKACQRVTRGVKSLLKYFLTLMRLFGDTREHWRSGSSCHST